MEIHEVSDVSFNEIVDRVYDVGFFASGFEIRSTHAARNMDLHKIILPVFLKLDGADNQPISNISDNSHHLSVQQDAPQWRER